jgi:hypothetical protein
MGKRLVIVCSRCKGDTMKSTVNLLSLVLASTLMFFAGCGGKPVASSYEANNQSASQYVVVDQLEPAFIVFTGIPKTIDKEQLERIKAQVAGRDTLIMLTWEQFIAKVDDYAQSVMLRDDYPDVDVVDGIVCLVASENGTGAPWGLTWNGGIALTFNDYQHVRRTYKLYKADPASYKPIRDSRRDPVNPEGFLMFGGCR